MSARIKSGRPRICITCGAAARRQWCRLHDPARKDRDQAHVARVAKAQAKTH